TVAILTAGARGVFARGRSVGHYHPERYGLERLQLVAKPPRGRAAHRRHDRRDERPPGVEPGRPHAETPGRVGASDFYFADLPACPPWLVIGRPQKAGG